MKISRFFRERPGGGYRNRTDLHGFAIQRIACLPTRLKVGVRYGKWGAGARGILGRFRQAFAVISAKDGIAKDGMLMHASVNRQCLSFAGGGSIFLIEIVNKGCSMQLVGTFTTPNASKYLQQLCKHFAHKIEVSFDEQAGRIPFTLGVAEVSADASALHVRFADVADDKRGDAKMVIDKHLERFAFREGFTAMAWQD